MASAKDAMPTAIMVFQLKGVEEQQWAYYGITQHKLFTRRGLLRTGPKKCQDSF